MLPASPMARFPEDFQGGDGLEEDRLSAAGPIERRADHPYRDKRDALIARRRALARELAEAERSAARRQRVARELEAVDEELRGRGAPLIDTITTSTPCRARWEDMRGDDVVRRCPRCDREVHDLTRMTRDETEALFTRAAATPYVRLRRRPDGRIVTADCPADPPSAAARAARVVAAGVLFGASATAASAIASAFLPAFGGARAPSPSELAPRGASSAARTRTMAATEARTAARAGVDAPQPASESEDRCATGARLAPLPDAVRAEITRDELDQHIRRLAPQSWEIDRALVDRALESRAGTQGVRLLPHERAGRVVGVKVYGIRRVSLLGRLGLRSGDTIVDIDGEPVRSQDGVLESLARRRGADALFVRIARRGEERVHVYRVSPRPRP